MITSKDNSKITRKRGRPRRNRNVPTDTGESKVVDAQTLPEASPNVFILPPELLRQLGIQLNETAETTNDGTKILPAVIYERNSDNIEGKPCEDTADNVRCKDNSEYIDNNLSSNPPEEDKEELNTESSSNHIYENGFKIPPENSSSIMETVTLMKSSLLLSPSFELTPNDSQFKSPVVKKTEPSANISCSTMASDSDFQLIPEKNGNKSDIKLENSYCNDGKLEAGVNDGDQCVVKKPTWLSQHSIEVHEDNKSCIKPHSQNNKNYISVITHHELTKEHGIENYTDEQYSLNISPIIMKDFEAYNSSVVNDFNHVASIKDAILSSSNINSTAITPNAGIHYNLSKGCVDTFDSFSDDGDDPKIVNCYQINKNQDIRISEAIQENVLTTNSNLSKHIKTNSCTSRTNKISVISDEIVKAGNCHKIEDRSMKSPSQSVVHSQNNISFPISRKMNVNREDNFVSTSHKRVEGDGSQFHCNNNIMLPPMNQTKITATCSKDLSINSDQSHNSYGLQSKKIQSVYTKKNFPAVIEKKSTSHAISDVNPSVVQTEKYSETLEENSLHIMILDATVMPVKDVQSRTIPPGNIFLNNINSLGNDSDISLVPILNKIEKLDPKNCFKNIAADETEACCQLESTHVENPVSFQMNSVIQSPKVDVNRKVYKNKNKSISNSIHSNTSCTMVNSNNNPKVNEAGTPQVYTRKKRSISPKKVNKNEENVSLIAQYLKAAEQACHKKYNIAMDSAIRNPKKITRSITTKNKLGPTVINTHGVEKPGGLNNNILKDEFSYTFSHSIKSEPSLVTDNEVKKYDEELTKNNRFSVMIQDSVNTGHIKMDVEQPTVVFSGKELEYCNEKCIDDKAFSSSAGQNPDVNKINANSADHMQKTTGQPIELSTRCSDSSVCQPVEKSILPNFEVNKQISCVVETVTPSKELTYSASPNRNGNIRSSPMFDENRISSSSPNVQPKTYSRKRTLMNSSQGTKSSPLNSLQSVNEEVNIGTESGELEQPKNFVQDSFEFQRLEVLQKSSCTKSSPGHSEKVDFGEVRGPVNNNVLDIEKNISAEILEIGDMKSFDNSYDDNDISVEEDGSSDFVDSVEYCADHDASGNVNSSSQIDQTETSPDKDDVTVFVNIEEKSSKSIWHIEHCVDDFTPPDGTHTFPLYKIGDQITIPTRNNSLGVLCDEVSTITSNEFNIGKDNRVSPSDDELHVNDEVNFTRDHELRVNVGVEASNTKFNESNTAKGNTVSITVADESHLKVTSEIDKELQVDVGDKCNALHIPDHELLAHRFAEVSNKSQDEVQVGISRADTVRKNDELPDLFQGDIEDVSQTDTVHEENELEVTCSTLNDDDEITWAANEPPLSDGKVSLEISEDALQINTRAIPKRKRGRPRRTGSIQIKENVLQESVTITDNCPSPRRKSLRPRKSRGGSQELNESRVRENASLNLPKESRIYNLTNVHTTEKKNITASDEVGKDFSENLMNEMPVEHCEKLISNTCKIEVDSLSSSEDEKLSTAFTKNRASKRKRQISSSSEEDLNKCTNDRRSQNSGDANGGETKESSGKCAICQQEVNKSNWLTHREHHNDLAWREGEPAIDLTDSRTVYRILFEKQKRTGNKLHTCDKCGVTRMSIPGFMSHLLVCQKTEDQIKAAMEACPMCDNLFMPYSLRMHTNSCQGLKKKKPDKVATLVTETAESEPPKKRIKRSFEIRVEEPPANQKHVKCAVCSEYIKSSLWEQHLQKNHYYLAWFEGGTPLDLNDEYFMVSILNRSLKSNKVLVCYLCGDKRGSSLGLIAHLTTCGKTEEELEAMKVKCTMCERKIMPFSMKAHMANHTVREDFSETHTDIPGIPVTPNDTPGLSEAGTLNKSGRQMRKAAINAGKNIQKLEVAVEAPKCNIKAMYTSPWNGTVHHIRMWNWQRDLDRSGRCRCPHKGCSHHDSRIDDMVTHHKECPYRQTLYLCKYCKHKCEREDDIEKHVQQHIVVEKKDQNFEISEAYLEGIKKMYKPPWRGVTDPITIEEWKRELMVNGIICCPNKECDYRNVSQDEILKHHDQDCQHHSTKYTCKMCHEQMESEEAIKLHIMVQHNYKNPAEQSDSESSCSSGDESEEESSEPSDNEEEEEEGVVKEEEEEEGGEESIQGKGRNQPQHKDNGKKVEIYKKTKAHMSFKDCMEKYYKWMDKLSDFHFAKCALFPEYPCPAYEPVPAETISAYLPPIEQSCNIAHSTVNKDNAKARHNTVSFKTYQLFEGDANLKDSMSFFVGGTVSALCWAPVPPTWSEPGVPVQHLAVCTHRDADARGLPAQTTHSHPALIQIWTLGHLSNENKSFKEPASFELGIAHEYGTVWSLDWCPSGGDEVVKLEQGEEGESSSRRMGLLAAACSDGSTYIFAVCHPELLPKSHTQYPIYKTTPAVELRLTGPEQCHVQATCVHWSLERGHNIVVVGYSDGTVAMFDLHSTSVLLRSVVNHTVWLAPYFRTQLLSNHVTALHIYPRSWYADGRALGCLLGAASYGRAGVWARVGAGAPREVGARRVNAADMVLTPHWPTLLLAVDDPMGKWCGVELVCRAWTGSYAVAQPAEEQRRLQSGGGEGCAAAADAWTGIGALATNSGVVTLTAPMHPLVKQRPFKIHMTICQLVKLPKVKQEDSKSSLEIEVEKYADAALQYGVVIRDAPVWNHVRLSVDCHHGRLVGGSQASRFPLSGVSRLAWSPSRVTHAHLAQGLACGLVHVSNVRPYDTWKYSSSKAKK